MWNSALAWKYADAELRVTLPAARKRKMRCHTVDEVKRILAAAEGADRMFFWLVAETGLRAGEATALLVNDVNTTNRSIEVSKAIWHGEEDEPKTAAGSRRVCVSSVLAAALAEYLAGRAGAGRTDYLFETDGKPWSSGSVLDRLDKILAIAGIPKHDPAILSRLVGRNRTIDQATRSEKRAASAGLHTFRHTSATVMDSIGTPTQVKKQRLGHSDGDVTGSYTHTFTKDERDTAEKLGEIFYPFPILAQSQNSLPGATQEVVLSQ